MNNPPIPPLQPGVTQPVQKKASKSTEVVELQRDLRSPHLPTWTNPHRVVVQRTKAVRGLGE